MSSSVFRLQKHTLPCQHIRQFPRATALDQEDTLFLAVNQYTPIDNPYPKTGDVTIIAAHANGVPKELYEPLWDELYKQSKATGAFQLGNIFIADVAWQGESSVLNEGKAGNDPSWYDHPRDLLHLINHYRHHVHRPIVGIGHSMGGNNIASLAILHPRLFTSIILLDPVIDRMVEVGGSAYPAFMSTFRRDVWPSREFAAETFRSNKFYQSWDSRVLDKWIKYGLRELPTLVYPTYPGGVKESDPPPAKPVTLTTTKHQEVFSFLRPLFPEDTSVPYKVGDMPPRNTHPDLPFTAEAGNNLPTMAFYRSEPTLTFDQLPHLRPPTYFIFGGKSEVSPPDSRQRKLDTTGYGFGGNGGEKAGGVHHFIVEKGGHFFPFESPPLTAELVQTYVKDRVQEWRQEEEELKRIWANKSVRERSTLSERYIENMKPLAPPGRGRAKM